MMGLMPSKKKSMAPKGPGAGAKPVSASPSMQPIKPPGNGLKAAPTATPKPAAPAPLAPAITPTPAPVSRNGLGQPAAPGDPAYVGYQDNTATLVNDMAQQDSLLMQQAATSGLQTANDRGMVNSSMAAGASQAATLDYIVPIASQDANQAFTKNMSGIQTQQELALAEFDRETQQALQKTQNTSDAYLAEFDRETQQTLQNAQNMSDAYQAELDRDLAIEQQTSSQDFESGQTATQLEFQAAQLATQQAFESGQSAQLQAFEASLNQGAQDFEQQMAEFEAQQLEEQREFEAQQADLDRQIQTALAEMDLAETDQAAATAMLTDAWSDYNQMYAQILANPDLSAEERQAQIRTNQEMLDDRITYTTELYGTAFDWPENVWNV